MALLTNVDSSYYLKRYVAEFIANFNATFGNVEEIGDDLGDNEYFISSENFGWVNRYLDMLGAVSQERGPNFLARDMMLLDNESNICLTVIIMYNLYSQRLKFVAHSYARFNVGDHVFYPSFSLKKLLNDHRQETTVSMLDIVG